MASSILSVVVDAPTMEHLTKAKIEWESIHRMELSKSAFYRILIKAGLECMESDVNEIMESIHGKNGSVRH